MLKRLDAKGLTLVELLFAVGILAVVALSVLSSRYFMAKRGQIVSDKAFAAEKAIQMMEELKSLVANSGQSTGGVAVLDTYDDGSSFYNPVLTTDKSVSSPGDPLSNNRTSGNGWRFLRNISIQHVPNDPLARKVFIRVFKSSDSSPSQPDTDLADVGGILRTVFTSNPPSQVFDVYILALANVPGWWVQVWQLQNTFNTIIQTIQQVNPGLIIRKHYITRTAFGRDQQYYPFINQQYHTDTSNAVSWVYLYPGTLNDDNGASNQFYSSADLAGIGNVNIDGSLNTSGNSICDMYNHAVRYPDEVRLYNLAVAQAQATGGTPPEPSLRMLLEEMNSEPQSFTNSLIMNLHGELLPMPAMRNYSDAAKDPALPGYPNGLSGSGGPNIRVVTHPERLHFRTSDNLNLRVYAYYDGMDGTGGITSPANYPATAAVSQITILLPNETTFGTFNPSTQLAVTAIVGTFGSGAVTVPYSAVPMPPGSGSTTMGMYWNYGATIIGGTSEYYITLFGTPLRCPQITGGGSGNGGGLPSSAWLYGREYIPCPVLDSSSNNFGSHDLTNSASSDAKNTARWLIALKNLQPCTTANPYTFETRIGPDFNSGAVTDNPPNLSRTYAWLGDTVVPPITEQYQFIGDPRHCPYLDVKNGSPNSDPVVIGPDGYNWYFTQIPNGTSGYTGFKQTDNSVGWGTEANAVDVPRYYQIFRNALLNTQAVWSTMNGFSYYYYGLGGEFGGDQSPFGSGVSFAQNPWTPGSTSVKTVDEILTQSWASANVVNAHVIMDTTHKWYAKYWLGELYPDSQYTTWASKGNLPTGTGNFYREAYNSANLTGTNWMGPTRKLGTSTSSEGCASFFNGISSGSKFFQHDAGPNNTQNAAIQQLGINLQPLFTIPLASPVSCTRPWCIDYSGSNPNPTEWSNTVYKSVRTTLSIPSITTGGTTVPRNFYQSDDTNSGGTWQGSGVVQQTLGSQNAYYVVSGLALQANLGSQELGEIATMEMLRTFMDGGLYSSSAHIVQLPLVTLIHPNTTDQLINPSAISVTWTSAWQRWGANPYTEEYAPITYTADNSVTINYNLKYSTDNGNTWKFVQDNSAAVTGVYNSAYAVSGNSYSWTVSDTTLFPQGDYDLRLEAYRENYPIHYSFHEQDTLFISR